MSERLTIPGALARTLGVSREYLHQLCVEHGLARVNVGRPGALRPTWRFPESTGQRLRELIMKAFHVEENPNNPN